METVNAFYPVNQKTHPSYTLQNLAEDPLIVLRHNICVSRYVDETNLHKLKSLLFHLNVLESSNPFKNFKFIYLLLMYRCYNTSTFLIVQPL